MKGNLEPADMALTENYTDMAVWPAAQVADLKRSTALHEPNLATLYRHIDIDNLLAAFGEHLHMTVSFDLLEFRNSDLDVGISICEDETAIDLPHTLRHRITDGNGYLGAMEISRTKQFRSDEVRHIKAAVNSLKGPLRNASLYKRACQSAFRDPLTGVRNRAALDEALSQKSESSLSRETSLVLLVCDVDRFKSVNDNCGHVVGDEVLRHFAQTLRDNTRESDIVYRYGGDEFVVALPATQIAGGRELAERIRLAVKSTTVYVDNACINLTTTIGLTEVTGTDSLDDAFLRADEALLNGKRLGKDRVVCN